ncbi:CCA-adding enzyme [Halovivax ruber XH-70]|uniref:CCA-adding enzyme n=1 Tax=Halovivax ruber (strain DSM 18193 / JCM 13892 / XH-70) TaxID=797302 RepID=L0IHC6_HALRX|nr:CCA tRNA nucleotidyltransferase [Halovivax ruber]AGB17362.1 CCA-adding enzyme [Halovivax ruber XH-70]
MSTDGDDRLADVLSTVLDRVEPDANERAALDAVADSLLDRAETAVTERHPDADVMLVGSTARDTWISGDRDIDVFVRFPAGTDRETLERDGLAVGHETLPDGHEEYAEHPYVTGERDGFAVDVVPCYRLDAATDIRSAVDRTPFHTTYLQERLDPALTAEVRLAKAFLKAIGVYGSDLRTRGFSGYLTELLVLEYGGFRPLLEAAADWHPPVHLDPEAHGETAPSPSRDPEVDDVDLPFDDPLIVIDPTDPGRNVAAVCSAENVARFQHHARALLADPELDHFESADPEPLTPAELETVLADRATTPVAIRFDAPDLVDDQLYPQLERSRDGLVDALNRQGFDVCRSAAWADETAVLWVELAVAERPAIEPHEGPPVHVREHAEGFFDAYADDPDVYGPYLDGDRYVVEREREYRTAPAFLDSDALFGVRLGAHVETALEEGYDVLQGDDVTELCPEFGLELARYVRPSV